MEQMAHSMLTSRVILHIRAQAGDNLVLLFPLNTVVVPISQLSPAVNEHYNIIRHAAAVGEK